MQKWARYLVVFVWATVSVLSVSLLHSSHVFNPNPQGRWVLTHIIDPVDNENKRIEDYLLQRHSVKAFDELVILLKPNMELRKNLEKQGYIVSFGNIETLLDHDPNFQSPYFLVTSPRGEGVYAGNYGVKIQDLEIAQSYFSNKILSNFPISGCGNSVRAQKFFDPQSIILAHRGEP
ncbi:hypothetical protein [Bdellovibrio bacteriovorus]|uniref:hypothetical protein n=1 Tax=Bdellovibrio bacteriovorus TaxID=959 RepID=UPI0035A8EE74